MSDYIGGYLDEQLEALTSRMAIIRLYSTVMLHPAQINTGDTVLHYGCLRVVLYKSRQEIDGLLRETVWVEDWKYPLTGFIRVLDYSVPEAS